MEVCKITSIITIMSSWGYGIFENDDAADWVDELEQSDDLSLVDEALNLAIEADDYVEATEAAVALAAVEVVAALNTHPADDLPEQAYEYVERIGLNASPSLIKRALRALKKVRKNSELRDTWTESGDIESWLEALSDLEQRLV